MICRPVWLSRCCCVPGCQSLPLQAKGYAARSAFKLEELQRRFRLIPPGMHQPMATGLHLLWVALCCLPDAAVHTQLQLQLG